MKELERQAKKLARKWQREFELNDPMMRSFTRLSIEGKQQHHNPYVQKIIEKL